MSQVIHTVMSTVKTKAHSKNLKIAYSCNINTCKCIERKRTEKGRAKEREGEREREREREKEREEGEEKKFDFPKI